MIQNLADLRKTPAETLIREYDLEAGHVMPSLAEYRNEIARRYAVRQTAEIIKMSQRMLHMTEVITFLTIVLVVAVLANLLT